MFALSLVSALLFSFSPSAEAGPSCPRWDGHYKCEYRGSLGDRDFDLDIKTEDQRGQTVYVANGKEVYPDGKPHHTDSLPILDQFAHDVDYVATCQGSQKVNVRGTATVKKNGMRAQLNGYLLDQSRGREVRAVFTAKVGFFQMNFNVPCVKK